MQPHDLLLALGRLSANQLEAVEEQGHNSPALAACCTEEMLELADRRGAELSRSDPAEPIPEPADRDLDDAFQTHRVQDLRVGRQAAGPLQVRREIARIDRDAAALRRPQCGEVGSGIAGAQSDDLPGACSRQIFQALLDQLLLIAFGKISHMSAQAAAEQRALAIGQPFGMYMKRDLVPSAPHQLDNFPQQIDAEDARAQSLDEHHALQAMLFEDAKLIAQPALPRSVMP